MIQSDIFGVICWNITFHFYVVCLTCFAYREENIKYGDEQSPGRYKQQARRRR